MKTKLMTMMLMAGGALFGGTHFSVGVHIGGPPAYLPVHRPPARAVVRVYRPPCPGPRYIWIDGYYDGYGRWFNGYWALPPYAGAYWVAPRHHGGRYYHGYWTGPRGHHYPPPHRGHRR
jgi:hypothetical protein